MIEDVLHQLQERKLAWNEGAEIEMTAATT